MRTDINVHAYRYQRTCVQISTLLIVLYICGLAKGLTLQAGDLGGTAALLDGALGVVFNCQL